MKFGALVQTILLLVTLALSLDVLEDNNSYH